MEVWFVGTVLQRPLREDESWMDTSINVTIILMASTQGLVPIGYISWCPNEHFCPTYLTKEKYELEENLKILWFILSSKNETQKGMGQQTQGHTVSSETKIDSNSSHLTLRPCSFLCFILRCPRLTQTHVKLWPGPWKISLLYCISVCTVAHGY